MPYDACFERERLSAYLDGELPPAEREAARAHLAACPSCAAALKELSAPDAALRALPAVEPPPFFAARVAAAARGLNEYHGPFRRFLRFPVPAMAALTAFIVFNLFTFAFNINAMENGPRRELARKVAAQLARPASLINPVAVARLCGECSKYLCLCMHEAGKKSLCPCKDCEMDKKAAGGAGEMNMEGGENVH
jgi:anti-sigma factor RsiW